MTRILVTGATGFIGRALCPVLRRHGLPLSAATRNPRVAETIPHVDVRPIPGIGPGVDWSGVLRDVTDVIHLAARLPDPDEDETPDVLKEYRRVNVEGAVKLARDAAQAGVRRFVYLSTAKVHGEETPDATALTELSPARPVGAYAQSKWDAEQALAEVAAASRLELVVVRPPLVYGPGVKGNFLSLMRLCLRAPTVPFGRVRNRRSLIYVGNLADAVIRCLEAPEAAGQRYLVRDAEDVSTPELVRLIATAMGRRVRQVPVPRALLRIAAELARKQETVRRLTGSFRIDDGKIRRELGWTPPFSVVQGLNGTTEWFTSTIERP